MKELKAEDNLLLVHSVLHRYCHRYLSEAYGFEYEDLYSTGCVGLVKAVNGFDPGYGTAFSTYAVPMILGEIRRYIRDTQPYHVSRSLRDLAIKILQSGMEEAPVEKIAAAFHVSEGLALEALNTHKAVISLETPVFASDGDPIYLADSLGKTDDFDSGLVIDDIKKRFTPEERVIFSLWYHQDAVQEDIAEVIGISQAQVSRTIRAIKAKIKRYLEGAPVMERGPFKPVPNQDFLTMLNKVIGLCEYLEINPADEMHVVHSKLLKLVNKKREQEGA